MAASRQNEFVPLILIGMLGILGGINGLCGAVTFATNVEVIRAQGLAVVPPWYVGTQAVLGVLLLVGGIGVLMRKEWGRLTLLAGIALSMGSLVALSIFSVVSGSSGQIAALSGPFVWIGRIGYLGFYGFLFWFLLRSRRFFIAADTDTAR